MKFYRVTGRYNDRDKTPVTRTIVATDRKDCQDQVSALSVIEDPTISRPFHPNPIQKLLAEAAAPILECYKADLGLDVEMLDTFKGAFLWFVRKSGTHLWRPLSFATNLTTADAVGSLTEGPFAGEDPAVCFVGCAEPATLKKISPARAREIATLWTRDERNRVRELPGWKPKDDLPRAAALVKALRLLGAPETPAVRTAIVECARDWGLDNSQLPHPAIRARVDTYVRECMAY